MLLPHKGYILNHTQSKLLIVFKIYTSIPVLALPWILRKRGRASGKASSYSLSLCCFEDVLSVIIILHRYLLYPLSLTDLTSLTIITGIKFCLGRIDFDYPFTNIIPFYIYLYIFFFSFLFFHTIPREQCISTSNMNLLH